MIRFTFFLAILFLFSCSTSTVEKKKTEKQPVQPKNYSLDKSHDVVDTKNFDNGLMIEWFEKGKGEEVKSGDMVMIDYKVRLKDGTIVDGNHLLKKETFPFLVGYQMQTAGWDQALTNMKIGDFARIKIPPHLARGEKGIEGLIPPNAVNLLTIRLVEKVKPDREIEGTRVWIIEENESNKLKFNEGMEISFHAMVSSESNPLYVNTYRTNTPFTYRLGDQGIVPGLRKALINAKISDRMFVVVPSSEAYGSQGYMDFVKPDEDVFYNILVMDIVKK